MIKNDFDCSILKIADDFYEAYIRCKKPKNVKEDGCCIIETGAVNVPAIVNGSFALELYLKSMIKEKSLEHKFNVLFDSLPEKISKEIKRNIETELRKCNLDYNECLNGISNSFTYWRYISEKEDFGFGFNKTMIVLPIFIECVREYVLKKIDNKLFNGDNYGFDREILCF